MASKSTAKVILGITDKTTVKLDFDDTPFRTVKYWAERACDWFKLEGFIILRSSKNHYHIVSDRAVVWRKNVHIMNWVTVESQIPKAKDYALMQGIKESSTLRIGPKQGKPSPRIVYRFGKRDREIQNFLKKRIQIKDIITRDNFARLANGVYQVDSVIHKYRDHRPSLTSNVRRTVEGAM